jgi:dTDP-4-dehydrorhamnose 3,5-epimerase
MKITPLRLEGTFIIELDPKKDERGFLMRAFDKKIFEEYSIPTGWVQENQSNSTKKDIVRGLHFQFPPFMEAKMVRVLHGAIQDYFVDLRKGSPTYGQYDTITLTEDNYKAVIIGRGLAHGFCTLTDDVIMMYHHDNYYSKKFESGIIWNDKDIAIAWPPQTPMLSERDKKFMTFKEFDEKHNGLTVAKDLK